MGFYIPFVVMELIKTIKDTSPRNYTMTIKVGIKLSLLK